MSDLSITYIIISDKPKANLRLYVKAIELTPEWWMSPSGPEDRGLFQLQEIREVKVFKLSYLVEVPRSLKRRWWPKPWVGVVECELERRNTKRNFSQKFFLKENHRNQSSVIIFISLVLAFAGGGRRGFFFFFFFLMRENISRFEIFPSTYPCPPFISSRNIK